MEPCENIKFRIPGLDWLVDAATLKNYQLNWGHGHILRDIIAGTYTKEDVLIRILLTQIPLRISSEQPLILNTRLIRRKNFPDSLPAFTLRLESEEEQLYTVERMDIDHIQVESCCTTTRFMRIRFSERGHSDTQGKFGVMVCTRGEKLLTALDVLAIA